VSGLVLVGWGWGGEKKGTPFTEKKRGSAGGRCGGWNWSGKEAIQDKKERERGEIPERGGVCEEAARARRVKKSSARRKRGSVPS